MRQPLHCRSGAQRGNHVGLVCLDLGQVPDCSVLVGCDVEVSAIVGIGPSYLPSAMQSAHVFESLLTWLALIWVEHLEHVIVSSMRMSASGHFLNLSLLMP